MKFSTEDLGAGTYSIATDLDWLSFISSAPENAIMALPFLLVCSKCEFVTAASFIVLDMVAENVTFDPNYVDVDRALSIPSSTDINNITLMEMRDCIHDPKGGEDAMISHASKNFGLQPQLCCSMQQGERWDPQDVLSQSHFE
eukprot:scaffold10272_cov276-Chaetoceros_neogracile.AAC.10